MSEEELQEYNLEYLEALQSEEIFGGDYTSAVELKYAKKEIERLNKELELERQIKKEVREYITKQVHRNQQFYEMDIENILEILDKVGETDDSKRDV